MMFVEHVRSLLQQIIKCSYSMDSVAKRTPQWSHEYKDESKGTKTEEFMDDAERTWTSDVVVEEEINPSGV
jgi:hypothetical protein